MNTKFCVPTFLFMFDSPAQEIKSRLDIVDIIQEYIPVKPAGTHNLKALCPFHNEKSPSLMISRDKQIWHCFGCAKGGDVFTFVQEYEGMSFPEVLRHLASRAGVTLKQQNPALINQKTRLLDILNLTTKYYQKYLEVKPEAQIARDYLAKRQLKSETVEQFKLGYSPDSFDEIKNFLRKRGYSEKEMFLAGLLVESTKSKGLYDRFRGRLMFPIFDHNGAVVGFTARTLKEESETGGKYINSPQTMVYNKSQIIYGLNFAKQEIKKDDLAVVVEGNMDVIASHQAGIANVVASSGTALTFDEQEKSQCELKDQVNLIKRYTNNIAFSFDADIAGENAAKRGIEAALLLGMNVQVVTIPYGKDPDDCIKHNPDDWKKAISEAEDFMQYYFDKTFAKLNLQQVQDRKKAAQILLPMIKKINDPIEHTFWLKKLAEKLDVDESVLYNLLQQVKLPQNNIQTTSQPTPSKPVIKTEPETRDKVLSNKLLAAILQQPQILETANQHLTSEMIIGEINQNLYKSLIIYYTETVNIANNGIHSFGEYLARNASNIGDSALESHRILELLAVKEFSDISPEDLRREGLNLIDNLKQNYLLNKRKQLQQAMQKAEKEGNDSMFESLIEKFKKLI